MYNGTHTTSRRTCAADGSILHAIVDTSIQSYGAAAYLCNGYHTTLNYGEESSRTIEENHNT